MFVPNAQSSDGHTFYENWFSVGFDHCGAGTSRNVNNSPLFKMLAEEDRKEAANGYYRGYDFRTTLLKVESATMKGERIQRSGS
jgi:hypothetical protein